MSTKSPPMIDADSHFQPRVDVVLEYGAPGYRREALQALALDAVRFATPGLRREGFRGSGLGSKLTGGPRSAPPENVVGHADVDARAELLAETGFEQQVLIPDGVFALLGGVSSGRRLEPGVQILLAQAFNDAAADAQARRPDRFIASAIVPSDVEEAIREIQRAARLGIRSVTIGGNWTGRNFDDFHLLPLWKAVADAAMLVLVHHNPFSCQVRDHVPTTDTLGGDRMRRLHVSNYLGFAFEYALAMASLTLGGVLEAVPALRLCFYEAGGSWLPWVLYTLDRTFRIEPQCARCSSLPSEAILRSCLVAIEPDEVPIRSSVAEIGSSCFVVGSDYPHPPSTYPNTVEGVRKLPGLTDADREGILGANFARLVAGAP